MIDPARVEAMRDRFERAYPDPDDADDAEVQCIIDVLNWVLGHHADSTIESLLPEG